MLVVLLCRVNNGPSDNATHCRTDLSSFSVSIGWRCVPAALTVSHDDVSHIIYSMTQLPASGGVLVCTRGATHAELGADSTAQYSKVQYRMTNN